MRTVTHVYYDPSISGDEEAASDYAAGMRYDGYDVELEVDPNYCGLPKAPVSQVLSRFHKTPLERYKEYLAAATAVGPEASDALRIAMLARKHNWHIRVFWDAVEYTRGDITVHVAYNTAAEEPRAIGGTMISALRTGGGLPSQATAGREWVESWLAEPR